MIIHQYGIAFTSIVSALVMTSHAQTADLKAFELAPLPYATNALEPAIDAKTMEIHHDKHHAAYVKNLNEARVKDPIAATWSLEQLVANLPQIKEESLRKTLQNNAGGHWNHTFFWNCMTPAVDSEKPSAALQQAIDRDFGNTENFKKQFAEAATKRFGSGWAWLILQKEGKLKIVSTANQDNPLMSGIVPDADLGKPLLTLDVWEHAYYLNYQNRRVDYITAWWSVINWNEVSKRFETK